METFQVNTKMETRPHVVGVAVPETVDTQVPHLLVGVAVPETVDTQARVIFSNNLQ
jgi:hypothetical protein